KINKVIIRNINIPLKYEPFNENFIRYEILSLLNLFLRYNKIQFNKESRDLIIFLIPFNLFRIITLP
ncbi:hypothetical protein B0T20DRAFT_358800, partial [Sordaria brevicollis]